MKKMLLAVDKTKGSEQAVQTVANWVNALQPESLILLHVQRLMGHSMIGEGLESDQDLEEIESALEGSDYLEQMNAASGKIISFYTHMLEQAGYGNIKPMVKTGYPAEQIISTAQEEDVDLIVVGSRGARFHSLLLGSVSREVANTAEVSVLIARGTP